jgi:hypothetical protein
VPLIPKTRLEGLPSRSGPDSDSEGSPETPSKSSTAWAADEASCGSRSAPCVWAGAQRALAQAQSEFLFALQRTSFSEARCQSTAMHLLCTRGVAPICKSKKHALCVPSFSERQ